MKKLFGKRGIALLTTMAILVSMVAMLGGLTLTSSAADYTPKRAVTYTVSEGVQQSAFMLNEAYKVAAGQTVTIKGYYNVYEINGDGFNILATQATTTATDGWVAFEKEYTVPYEGQWRDFGFWQASGKFALADITFTNAKGEVIYDMVTDTTLTAGTTTYTKSNPYEVKSIWYMLACYGTVEETASVEVVVDPAIAKPYTPKRTISMTAGGTQINAKIFLYYTNELGSGKTVTVKGYYKVDNYSAWAERTEGDQNIITPGGSAKGNVAWTPFEKSFTTGEANNLSLEFWYAQGTVSFADVIIEENGTKIYDMATDEQLVAGTYNGDNWAIKQGLWYFGYYSTLSDTTYTIDPVYVPETYTPSRVISMTTAGTQINGKIYLYYSNLLGSGKEVTVKGYYKVDNYSAWADRTEGDQNIITPGGSAKGNVAWTPFEKSFTTGEANNLSLEFWYAQGTVSFADVTISENGVYIYDMTSDADLVAGTYNADNWKIQQGIWYFGFYGGIDAATYTVGEAVEGGIVVVPPPYDPEVVELPEVPNLITADPNGYTPNRAFAIVKGVHTGPKASYAVFADETNYAVAGNKYYVFLKYAAQDLNGDEAVISINGTTVKTLTADSAAWETLLDQNGDPYSFDAVEVDDIVSIMFQVKGEGTGILAVADFIIADQNGDIVYSLANDKTMHMEGDLRYVTNGYWKGDPYVAELEGPTLFPIQTKVETYEPTAYISLTQDDKQRDSSAEAFLFLRTNNALFTAGQKYTIKGMIYVDIDAGYGGWGNASMSWGDSTGAAQIDGGYMLGTNGAWFPFVYADGSDVTFMGTTDEDWLKINLFKTYGTIALADIQILDAEGNVVYDMTTDEELKAMVGEYTGNVAGLGRVFVHALYNNGHGEVWFADATQSNTETSKQIPQFEESVEVPKDEDPCANGHDFVDGFCTRCEEPDPDYVPPVDDPCANGHDFVDGYCTRCQEPDPDYDPDGPAQTGDESMIFVMALGTFAVISLAALTLNKKKFNA